jgi:hypothetical protein
MGKIAAEGTAGEKRAKGKTKPAEARSSGK